MSWLFVFNFVIDTYHIYIKISAMNTYKIVTFDTETTGLIEPGANLTAQPYLASVSYKMLEYDSSMSTIVKQHETKTLYIKLNVEMPQSAQKVHGLSNEFLNDRGVDISVVLDELTKALTMSQLVVCHNTSYDLQILYFEALRNKNNALVSTIMRTPNYCTAAYSRKYAFNNNKAFRMTLQQLHIALFKQKFDGAHSSAADTNALAACFVELVNRKMVDKDFLVEPSYLCVVKIKEINNQFELSYAFRKNNSAATFHSSVICKSIDSVLATIDATMFNATMLVFDSAKSLQIMQRLLRQSSYQTAFGFKLATYVNTNDEFIDANDAITKLHKYSINMNLIKLNDTNN